MKVLKEIDISIKKDNIINNMMKSNKLYCLVLNAIIEKSMLVLQLSYSLATGKQFLGNDTMSTPGLYISTETDSGQLIERINTLWLEFTKESLYIIDRNGKGEVRLFDFEVDIMEFAKYKRGCDGGRIVTTGTPEQVSNCNESYTGEFLKKYLWN